MRLIDVDALKLKFQEECLAECAVCPNYEKDENGIWRCLLIDRAPIIDKWVNAKSDPPLPYTPVLVAIYDETLESYYRDIAWVTTLDNWGGVPLTEDERVVYWAPLLPAPEKKHDK
jgi:hypothetical protein